MYNNMKCKKVGLKEMLENIYFLNGWCMLENNILK